MIEEIVPIISNLGFPIAICLFVLIRMEKTIKENTKAIHAMLTYVKKN